MFHKIGGYEFNKVYNPGQRKLYTLFCSNIMPGLMVYPKTNKLLGGNSFLLAGLENLLQIIWKGKKIGVVSIPYYAEVSVFGGPDDFFKHQIFSNVLLFEEIIENEEDIIKLYEQSLQTGCQFHESTTQSLAEFALYDVLKWAHSRECAWNYYTSRKLSENGNLEMLKWAAERGCHIDYDTCDNAAFLGRLDIIQWARDRKVEWSSYTCARAVSGGHFDLLKWLVAHGCPLRNEAALTATNVGRLDILMWLKEHGCQLSKEICFSAARDGHINILQWALNNDCPCDQAVLNSAAFGGQIGVLEFLLSKRYPLNASVCTSAVEGGQLVTLRWLRDKKCRWNKKMCERLKVDLSMGYIYDGAKLKRYCEIGRWLNTVDCPCSGELHSVEVCDQIDEFITKEK